jgi:tetratricopeptide (TPR) repeat protein
MTQPLLAWFERAGRWHEFGKLIDAALMVLDDSLPAHAAAMTKLLQAKATVLNRQGRFAEAGDVARRALRRARAERDHDAIRSNLATIGNALVHLGQPAEARRYMEQALLYARRDRDIGGIASNTNNLANIEKHLGRYESARSLYQESLALKRELGEMRGVAVALHNLGNLHRAQQQWRQALPYLEEGLRVCESCGLESVRPSFLANLGATYLPLGRTTDAVRLLEQAISARSSGETHIETFARLTLVKAALAANDADRARHQLVEALGLATSMASHPYMLEGLMAFASFLTHAGHKERAASYCLYVARHATINEADRLVASQQLHELKLEADQLARATTAADRIQDLAAEAQGVIAELASEREPRHPSEVTLK